MSRIGQVSAILTGTLFALSLSPYCNASPVVSDNSAAERVEFGDEITSAEQQALREVEAISQDIQSLKSRVIELNKDLRLMEEKLLFPSSTLYSVFVSLYSGRFFELEAIKFKLDGNLVASHLYSSKQRQALARGGVHRLLVTNLSEGKHNATAFFTGIGSNGRAYKRAVTLDFNKDAGSEYLEIAIRDDGTIQEPAFELRQW